MGKKNEILHSQPHDPAMSHCLPLLKENKGIVLEDISSGLQTLFYCPLYLLSLTKAKDSQWTF